MEGAYLSPCTPLSPIAIRISSIPYKEKSKFRQQILGNGFTPRTHPRMYSAAADSDFRKIIQSAPKTTTSSANRRLRVLREGIAKHRKEYSADFTEVSNNFSKSLIFSTKEREANLENQLKILTTALDGMKEENERLRKLTQEIMLDHTQHKDMASTVHSFYQNVYMHESELNAEALYKKISEQKIKLGALLAENAKLKNENKKLVAALNQYRDLVRDFQGGRNAKTVDQRNRNLHLSIDCIREYKEGKTDKKSSDETCCDSARTTLPVERIGNSICKILRSENFKALIATLYTELSALVKASKIGIFIVDTQLRKLFQKERGLASSFTLNKDCVDLALSERNHGISPAFSSITLLKSRYRKLHSLVVPVLANEKLLLAVQLDTKPDLAKQKEEALEEFAGPVLSMCCATASKLIEGFLEKFTMQIKENYQTKLITFCRAICGERNHQNIVQTVEENVAGLYGFERACLLIDNDDHLYKLQGGITDKGELYISDVIKYPKYTGLTGKAIEEQCTVVSYLGKADAKFSDEVDNAASVRRIDNIIIIPLLTDGVDQTKDLVGVLQMMNYKYGDIPSNINEETKVVSDIIGRCIDNVNSFSKSFKVMLGLHGKLGNATNILEEGEKAVGLETKSVGKQLNDQLTQITKLMGELITSKKTQFLKEASQFYSSKK